MTAPVANFTGVQSGSSSTATGILTGDQWEAAQYAPHRVGQDPTKPMGAGRILTGDEWDQAQSKGLGALKLPALPKFAADATQRLNPNAGPLDRSIPEQLGAKVRSISEGFDMAALGLPPEQAAAAHIAAALGRQVVAPTVEHPLLTAALANPIGAVIGFGMAVNTIAQYGWQKAHELAMSPEDRARSEADPNRVSGEAAAVQAVMLGLGGLAGVKAIQHATDFGAGMMEAGAAGVKETSLGPEFAPGMVDHSLDAFNTERLKAQVARDAEVARQAAVLKAQVEQTNAATRDAERATEAARVAEEQHQEELTRQAALRALTGVRRRPASYVETPQGAETLGAAAATHGLPETASPFPPETPQDVAWKQGHAAVTESQAVPSFPEGFTMGGALTENRIPSDYTPPKLPRKEPQAQEGVTAAAPGEPAYRGPASLYGRLSDEALGAEYRALLEKRAQEEPAAMAPLWTPEREAEAVAQIENRRRPDGSLSPVDKRRLDYLQAAQGEGYNVGRHTFESAAAEQRLNAVNKHIAAVEKEIATRGLKPEDVALVQSGAGGLAPVEGTGPTRTRGLAASVEQRAVANELTDYLGDLPEYRQVNMSDQAAQATDLLANNPELARRVALGDAPAPGNLLPEAVFKAVERKATQEGDVATLRDLASGGLTEQATTMGQRLRALGERDPESPVAAMQSVEDARARHVGDVEDATAKIMADIEKTVKKANGSRADMLKTLSDFVDGLRC